MRIFLGFFGITRSLRHTIGSITKHIFEPLQQAGFAPARYGHFHLPDGIFNRRSGEFGLAIDREEAALLELQGCQLDQQHPALIAETLAIAHRYPDPYGDNYSSAANLCFQLRSLHELWNLIEPQITEQDWVVFLRPDLLYLDRLDLPNIVAGLSRQNADLAVPAWQPWGGLNDRFAIANARAAQIYATRITRVEAATKKIGALHAETLLAFTVGAQRLRVGRLQQRALRIRANGKPAQNDVVCFGLSPVGGGLKANVS